MIKTLLPISFLTLAFACTSTKAPKKTEKYRPALHFSPEKGWMNDPNGLVYLDGEYHLFYQYNPDTTVWAPMHWGHAVSTDLLHWKHLPIALYPDSLGMIFSGSAVIDTENTSGLGTKEHPAMVAIFTYHDDKKASSGGKNYQSQGLAFSLDKGRTWTKYAENPVLPNPGINDFRDPKVFWSNDFNKWFMTLAVQDHIEFYTSENLLSWKKESEFGKPLNLPYGVWECPDLFPMVVDNETKWVLIISMGSKAPNGGSGTLYFVGDFDGHTFVPTNNTEQWIDWGKDNYAGVTWNNTPDGKRLFIGWMNNWTYGNGIPTEKWRGANTIPRELTLIKEDGRYQIISNPVSGFDKLVTKSKDIAPINMLKDQELIAKEIKVPFELMLELNLENPEENSFSIELANAKGEKTFLNFNGTQFVLDNRQNGWDDGKGNFAFESKAPYQTSSGTMNLHLIIDHSSIEVFVNKGKLVMTSQIFPSEDYSSVSIQSNSENVKLKNGVLNELSSVW